MNFHQLNIIKQGFLLLLMSTSILAQAQNVGIGTLTPSFKLDVKDGSINTDSVYRITGITVLNVSGNGNLFAGKKAGRVNTAVFNTYIGDEAGYSNTSGDNNAFFGRAAGHANTTGNYNSFFGASTGIANTTGANNAFFGAWSGQFNSTGTYNAFFGGFAGNSNTTGSFNSYFGYSAGQLNTTGGGNSFFGRSSGTLNTTGFKNSFFGDYSGFSNSTGNSNSFFGSESGALNSTGVYNSFFGQGAGYSNTTGYENSFFGKYAGYLNSTGNNNSFFGTLAGTSTTTGNSNSFFGVSAGNSNNSGNYNAFFGENTGFANTTGYSNSFYGTAAGIVNTTGYANAFFGLIAGNSTTTGYYNTAHGASALTNNTTGTYNTALGYNSNVGTGALTNATALGANASVNCSNCMVLGSANINVGIGTNSPGFPLNFSNVAGDKISFNGISGAHYGIGLGNNLLQIHTDLSGADIAFGYGSSASFIETMRVKGNGNVGIGITNPGFPLNFSNVAGDKISFNGISGAHYGIGVGINLLQIHTGSTSGDIVFGYGSSGSLTETMRIKGNGNVGIGTTQPGAQLHIAGLNLLDAENGAVIMSRYWLNSTDARASAIYHLFNSTAGNDQLVLGVSGDGGEYTSPTLYSNAKMVIQANGYVGIGTTAPDYELDVNGTIKCVALIQTSDFRLKKDIISIQNSLEKITRLNGYHYYWKNESLDNSLQTGVIAQEVQKLFPELVKTDKEGMLSVNYTGLIPVLIESTKELKEQIEELKKQNEEMRQAIFQLQQKK
jgi:hypothetical protein